MPRIKITNRTQNVLTFGGPIGSVDPYQTRTTYLTGTQMEQFGPTIQALTNRAGVDLVIEEDPNVDNRIEAAMMSSVVGEADGVVTMYVAMTGSDTTGDGSFTRPFLSAHRAAAELAKYAQPKGNAAMNLQRICFIPSPTYGATWDGGAEGSASFASNYVWDIQPHLPPNSGKYQTNLILVDVYTSPSTMGTVNDARFVPILSNLVPTAIATENGRPRYTFALGTFTASYAYLGRTVRVFDSVTGDEKWRGTVAFDRANVSGADQLVIQPSYSDPTTMSLNDRIMIAQPSVTLYDTLSLTGTPSCDVIFSGIEFNAPFGHTSVYTSGSCIIYYYGCNFVGEQSLVVSAGTAVVGGPQFAPDEYSPLSLVYPLTELSLWTGWQGGLIADSYSHRNALVISTGSLYLYGGVHKGNINVWDSGSIVAFRDAVVLHGGATSLGGTLRTSQTFSGRTSIIAHATVGLDVSGVLDVGSDALTFDAPTITGDAVRLRACRMDGNTYPILAVPMGATTTLTGGKAVNVVDSSQVQIRTSASTLRGSAATDVTVGATSYTYASLTSAVYTSDTTRGCFVRAS
jgi:hypothetical protein